MVKVKMLKYTITMCFKKLISISFQIDHTISIDFKTNIVERKQLESIVIK